jgi:CheY-like chemotaxis protein
VPAIVCSGEEAIIKVKENKPDLVLMDINLNGDIDGCTRIDDMLKISENV